MKDKSLIVNETFNQQIDIRKQDCPINAFDIIKSITNGRENGDKDPFYIVDLEDICNKHINWITQLPRVEPHYAVKCNTDPMLLKLLAFLGAGFDCASKGEISRMLELGVSPHRIIFANPCKQASYIKYAAKQGVDYMTFDNEAELHKIRQHHPRAKCVLRIVTNDEHAVCRFSMKFGADMETALKLVETAVDLGVDLVGVSFHVGSGQMSPAAFSEAIGNARKLFDYAREQFGLKFHLLDLGGGYPGASDSGDFFAEVAREINVALEEHFPADFFAHINGTSDEAKLRIIAEPGRYYACSAFTLCVSVIAKRVMTQTAAQQKADAAAYADAALDASKSIMYYINDGVYASFNCLFYDHAVVAPILLEDHSQSGKVYKSSIWGPTCDGLDVVVKECLLPELATEEYMAFKNMGAYTLSGAVAFNGIPLARCIYVSTHSLWETIAAAFDEPQTSLLEETVAAPTPCAIAFNRTRSMSLSLVEQRHDDSDTDAASTTSEDQGCVVDLISEEQKEDVDCAIIC